MVSDGRSKLSPVTSQAETPPLESKPRPEEKAGGGLVDCGGSSCGESEKANQLFMDPIAGSSKESIERLESMGKRKYVLIQALQKRRKE